VSSPTHFDRLGIPRRFAVDPAELERQYLARSRELHPDFHQQAGGAQQRASIELTAALNEAYATLKEPFRRAEYLVQLEGGPSAAAHKDMAPAFLEEMLDLRMEIEELREAGDPESPGMKAMEARLEKQAGGLITDVARRFAQYEKLAADDSGRRGALVQIRQTLNAAKYIQGLLRDLRAD
jgi:molecular chaperone HscB